MPSVEDPESMALWSVDRREGSVEGSSVCEDARQLAEFDIFEAERESLYARMGAGKEDCLGK